ncbi:MAG TPA: DUF4350 domain-containing protein [Verrucomicrobiae bacterium]|nr:DUF4350 domain-containing protein [Verrucomicrobiae bacterium]
MNSLKTFSGPLGVVLLLAGAGMTTFAPEQRRAGFVLMAVGGVLIITAVALNLEDLANILRGRAVRYGANATFYSLVVLLIVGAVNFLASQHHKRFDLTQEGAHTLSPQTVKILKSLQKDVELVAFFTETNDQRRKLEDLADEYRYQTDHLKVRLVDPIKSPSEARKYQISQDGTLVVLADTGEARTTSISEEDLTNAIIKSSRKDKKQICFTTGHGEDSTADAKQGGYSIVGDALRKENYDLKDVLLLQAAAVPAECSAVVVAGPTTALLAAEVDAITKYLDGGGRVFVLKRDPSKETGLASLLKKYGLKQNSDVVVDRLSRAIVGDETVPIAADYDDHPVTKELRDSRVVSIFPVASSIEKTQPTEPGVTSQIIARTGADAWGETGDRIEFDPKVDHPGPAGIVAVASGKLAGAEPKDPNAPADPNAAPTASAGKDRRLVVIGDSDFASNTYLHLSANKDLFLNSVAWLTEESDLISIRSREKSPQPITLTASRQNLLSLMTYVSPLIVVICGVVIWQRRKKL